ncbi:hypothetical protein AUJ66_01610 [Candidatus Desantisbacteria bacterium CG1_02_38_46]|uniref:Nucleotidyl transferase AbiEii/AbiGii toxin family protein n=3 Tax=unclassified Candidatus Desantisiibacteriota TaxID=3106372 RepID=A0A2H9PCV4_9BACT|nr:MAG: hypothetical protein AUJ66_01610 [Candidatus Desantisbacteria bacterium CG1_02_38_46]PIU52122.1 MAG: hypothetical protein COS91_00800 [Candidatus Desantisbacteria bacterium CG07_land_8_20_14_0_80_39_15]PIZ17217.1 MAG: hypothetical protein COY51_00770 [Candidatus Desantisbacteria bacterium CG_4_10_14_0_8_um_filter_39_17]
MLEVLMSEIEKFKTREERLNHLRECIQLLILKIVYEGGFFKSISFIGGTALRVIYDLRRFSEDMDFSLTSKNSYSTEGLVSYLDRQLELFNMKAEVSKKIEKNVHKIDCKFGGILFDTGISSFESQKLFIRLDVDTNPPAGWRTEISLVNKLFMFTLSHFDLPSLYACKLHACFFRRYTKGRDFYDLLWFLGKKIKPNFTVLNNAIIQTEKKPVSINESNFPRFLAERLSGVDFKNVRNDVERFLEDKKELALLDKETFLKKN